MKNNFSIKRFLKLYTPRPVWRMLRFVYSPRSSWRESQQLKQWKRMLAAAPAVKAAAAPSVGPWLNSLPNSGGLQLDVDKMSPERIFAGNMAAPQQRAAKIEGFDGVALDDALNWMEDFRHYSFVPLAAAVSEIVRSNSGKQHFSVLELGCGWGGFRPLLARFGANDYLGLDANPLPFKYSPHMIESPAAYRVVNLQQKVDFQHVFDVVCSFEVLEHIREDGLDELIATIRAHMGPGSLFIGTAAFTEEYDVHITVHRRDWWLERFSRAGLLPIPNEEKWTALLFRSAPHNWSSATSSAFVLRRND